MTNKVILVDCDGVLLSWEDGFSEWMRKRGYHFDAENGYGHFRVSKRYNIDEETSLKLICQFNESAAAGFLKPFQDAVHYVKRLNEEHGYMFSVITSFGDDPYSVKLREQNLRNVFGNVFDSIVCLPIGSHKEDELSKYKNSGLYWIEDHPKNAEIGRNLGLNSILIRHDYNYGYDSGPNSFPMMTNWKALYGFIIGEK